MVKKRKKNDVAERGNMLREIREQWEGRSQSRGLGFHRTIGDLSIIADRKPEGGVPRQTDRYGEWAVCRFSLLITSIPMVTSKEGRGCWRFEERGTDVRLLAGALGKK